MSTFRLPDLGEGLAEAEIVEWHVKVGDHVRVDQPMVSVETAKAVVEVPAPFSGVVTALRGGPGDIVLTGAALIEFDSGTVVGSMPSTSEEEYEEDPDGWLENREFKTPDGREKYDGDLEVMNDRISLKGRTIQVIIKLANIILTPDKPNYPGGKWHVEGMRNEKIVSSFIYYYASENISESRLAFRRATSEPHAHEQDDGMCMRVLYNMDRDSPCVQDIGDVVTKSHRCIAFPNLYQHQVQPFHLEDPTKPGHRKILVFFLIDPTERVPSTTDVAPQQREWVTEAMHGAGANSVLAKFPVEILTMISEENDGTMTRLEAERYREELMAERTVFVEANNEDYFGTEFNMCEH